MSSKLTNKEMDVALAELVNLKHHWAASGCPGELAERLIRKIDALPVSLDIHGEFLKSLKSEMEVDRELVPATVEGECGGPLLPVRNRGRNVQGHVELLDEHNGLIHGGRIYKKDYILECKAYRRFDYRKNRYNSSNIDVVAGVCEQRRPSGQVMETWSTARRLRENYTAISNAFPEGAFAWTMKAGARSRGFSGFKLRFKINLKLKLNLNSHTYGFYRSQLSAEDFRKAFEGIAGKNAPLVLPDNGRPDPAIYRSGYFERGPGWDTALENPFFNQQPSCAEGYPVCTPYIRIFAPHPDMDKTVVVMASAYREWLNNSVYNREALYEVKTFNG